METTVENMEQGLVQDDAVLTPMQETEETHPGLEELLTESDSEATEIQTEPTEEVRLPKREPGWVRQRVDKAVAKAVQETEARMRAEFESTIAPIRENMLGREADQLVASGEFKSRDRALEYLRLKNGLPGTVPQRQAQQQQQVNPETKARANLLAKQADRIKANYGIDVMSEFNSNPEVRQKIVSGEWDFYAVAEAMQEDGVGRQPAPRLVRSPGGGSGLSGKTSIDQMSDAQFEQLQKNLRAGKVYDAR